MSESLLRDVLFIPSHHQRNLSADRLICLVHEEWLSSLKYSQIVRDVGKSRVLGRDDAALLLAPSNKRLPRNWSKVCIKVVHKSDKLMSQLYNGPLYSTKPATSSLEHLTQAARENFRNLWAAAHVKYRPCSRDAFPVKEQFTTIMRSLLQRLSPAVYIHHPRLSEDNCTSHGSQSNQQDSHPLDNIVPIIAVIETNSSFFIIQPYIACSLLDMVNYSPTILSTSHAKSLFILYQILHAMLALHDRGVTFKELTMPNIRIDERLWVKCSVPFSPVRQQQRANNSDCHDGDLSSENTVTNCTLTDRVLERSVQIAANDSRFRKLSECENYITAAVSIMDQFHHLDIEMEDLAKTTEDWQSRRISNFKYLMILNHLAGRKLGDPNHHPVLPWVMDFTSANGGFRDLSMSKFRLNKGDSQLDFTYDAMSNMVGGSNDHIPHHVSDVLSDITYYVYKARRTPKNILCTYVRTKWVPNEYPQSIERMFQWTPDECIPEFFTDPTIFSSIHEDLPNLELPGWCNSSAELINRHMEVLESDQVSCTLHHWIDLTFGYKLSGAAAVKAKNVYLKLVDEHKNMVNHGVIQLFSQPHPNRLAPDKLLSALPPRVRATKARAASVVSNSSSGERDMRPDSSKIKLPEDFDPTADLDHLEALSSFTCKTAECLPPSLKQTNIQGVQFSELHQQMSLVWSDMQQFGCLMCEMFLASKLTTQRPHTTLRERFNLIGQICSKDSSSLPRLVQTAANILIHLDKVKNIKSSGDLTTNPYLLFEYPMVTSLGTQPPTPAILLQQYTGIMPFPHYFPALYDIVVEMKNVDTEIEKEISDLNKSRLERQKIEKLLSRKKVELLEKYLQENRFQIPPDGYELILPYIKELFEDSKTTVQAAWALLGLVGKNMGPQQLSDTLLPYLTHLFSGENTSPKHMKLYHRSFVVQLLMHVGLETFINHFCTLLVEAVAGYKDFLVEASGNVSQEDMEDETEDGDEEVVETDLMFEGTQTVVERKETVEGHEEVNTEDQEDIRPDQTEDDEDAVCGAVVFEDDEEEDHNLSNSSLSYTPESLSTDQVSTRSAESDQLYEDIAADRWSSDHGSLHSISHILPAMEETFPEDNEDNDIDTLDSRHSHSLSVHFEESNTQIDQSEAVKDFEVDQSNNSVANKGTSMIRSETDEFRQIHYSHTINICDVAAETLKWLSHRLGPLLTAKYLSKNLVRMLALCYLGDEQIVSIQENEKLPLSTRLVQGDSNALKVLECLTSIACIYGEQVVLIQYLRCIVDLIQVARRRLTVRAEAGLLAAIVLLRHIIPLLSDKTFLEILKESIVLEVLRPMLRLLTSLTTVFPSGSATRAIILYKFVDIMYVLGLRLGFEMTRQHLTPVLTDFFKPFEDIYSSLRDDLVAGRDIDSTLNSSSSQTADNSSVDDSYLNIKMDDVTKQYMIGSPVRADALDQAKRWRSNKANYSLSDSHMLEDKDEYTETRTASEEHAQLELQQTFSAELALASYIPLTSVFGSHHMEEALPSDDLIRKLCSQFDKSLYGSGNGTPEADTTGASDDAFGDEDSGIGSNVAIVGNRICLQTEDLGISPETSQLRRHFKHKGILRMDPDDTKCSDIDRKSHRHLKGNWLAYWEHELGLNERDTMFNFKQIKLQTFLGHQNSVRSLTSLDNENSFISSSKDKTVKLWSLTSFGDGSGRCREQFTYSQHKKSVFSVAYLQNLRLVASCDSTVHIWDPFTGDPVRQLESHKYSPVIVLTPLPTPSSQIMTATTENTLRFLDLRSCKYAHEYRCVIGTAGLIKCAAVSPDGSWIAVGFSTGNISLLNLYTGLLYGTWKGHDGEILQLKAVDKKSFITTAFDLTMKLWNIEGRELCAIKGYTEPVHCLGFYKSQVLGATTSNKIGVHSSCDAQASFTSTKLQSEVFKGVLTSMSVLPLNRTLLLGADNGLIRLFC